MRLTYAQISNNLGALFYKVAVLSNVPPTWIQGCIGDTFLFTGAKTVKYLSRYGLLYGFTLKVNFPLMLMLMHPLMLTSLKKSELTNNVTIDTDALKLLRCDKQHNNCLHEMSNASSQSKIELFPPSQPSASWFTASRKVLIDSGLMYLFILRTIRNINPKNYGDS